MKKIMFALLVITFISILSYLEFFKPNTQRKVSKVNLAQSEISLSLSIELDELSNEKLVQNIDCSISPSLSKLLKKQNTNLDNAFELFVTAEYFKGGISDRYYCTKVEKISNGKLALANIVQAANELKRSIVDSLEELTTDL